MRRWLLLWMAAAALAGAQPKPGQKEINLMLDQIRAAIRAEDWPEASRLAMRLNAALLNLRARSQASPLLELQHLEMLAGNNGMTRNPLLPRMARAAFAAMWTGDAIHQVNIILGHAKARDYGHLPSGIQKALQPLAGETDKRPEVSNLGLTV